MMGNVRIVFWDVQHGHAAYIRSPNDRHIVIDLGTGSYHGTTTFSPLHHLREVYGIQQLDYVIITHPHLDHIDDIDQFGNLSPKVLLRPKHLDRKPILERARDAERGKLEKYFDISDRYSRELAANSPDHPDNPENYGQMKIYRYGPTTASESNINNHSIVTIFEFAGVKALIPGDNEPPSWNELMENEDFLMRSNDVDVLLAPHHGRNSGYDARVVKHLNPRIVVVSDGRHQDTSAWDRYSSMARGWEVSSRKGSARQRRCLTTTGDGVIDVGFGYTGEGRSFLQVVAD